MANTPLLQLFHRQNDPEVNLTFYDARNSYRYVRQYFDQNANYVHFKKVAGFGSSGMVTIWSTDEIPSRQRNRDIAVKVPVQIQDPFFRMEMSWMAETFKGLEHFVQLVDLPGDMMNRNAYNDHRNLQGPAIMIMEYFSRGELSDILCRMNEAARINPRLDDAEKKLTYIPQRILWRLFLCVVRMCMGMAYPPQQPAQLRGIMRESLPDPNEDVYPWQIMHFDMHPQNIFVEMPNRSTEHGWAPRLKLADFGFTTEWDEDWTNEQKLSSANVGKPGYQAPEQREDDRIIEEYSFGPHTNIWNAGYIMFNCLSFYFTDDPEWRPQFCPMQMPDGSEQNINTWAPYLVGRPERVYQEFKKYSIELRTLIARCMAHEIEDRPALEELLPTIMDYINRGNVTANEDNGYWEDVRRQNPNAQRPPDPIDEPPEIESDELLRRWFQEYINQPIDREDPYGDLWDQSQ